jgi:hypothetical protein
MHLRSTTLLSLGFQSIDLPSPDVRTPNTNISHHMTELLPDVLSPICSSLLLRGAVRFPEFTTISRPSLTARRPPSHLPRLGRSVSSAFPPTPVSDLEDKCGDSCKSAKTSTLSGGPVPADGNTNVVGIVGGRISSDKDVPHPSMHTNLTPRPSSGTRARITRVGSVWVSCPVCNILCAYKTIRGRSKAQHCKNVLFSKY